MNAHQASPHVPNNDLHPSVRWLWAKSEPFHPLWCHLFDVAAVAQSLVRRFGGISQLPDSFVALVAGLHDLGKADAWFQNKAPELDGSLRERGIELPSRHELDRGPAKISA